MLQHWRMCCQHHNRCRQSIMTTSPTAKQLDDRTEQLENHRSVPPPEINRPRMMRAWQRRVILSTPICNAITRRKQPPR